MHVRAAVRIDSGSVCVCVYMMSSVKIRKSDVSLAAAANRRHNSKKNHAAKSRKPRLDQYSIRQYGVIVNRKKQTYQGLCGSLLKMSSVTTP